MTFEAAWSMPLIGTPRPSRASLLREMEQSVFQIMQILLEDPTQIQPVLRRHARIGSITALTSVLQHTVLSTLGDLVYAMVQASSPTPMPRGPVYCQAVHQAFLFVLAVALRK